MTQREKILLVLLVAVVTITWAAFMGPGQAQAQTTKDGYFSWSSSIAQDMDTYFLEHSENETGPYASFPVKHPTVKIDGVQLGFQEGRTYFAQLKACDVAGNCSPFTKRLRIEVLAPDVIPPDTPNGFCWRGEDQGGKPVNICVTQELVS